MNERVLVVIPAFNEENSILRVVEKLVLDCAKFEDIKIDYVVVNDASTDSTLEILKANKLSYLSHDVNLGIGSGFKTGIRWGLEMGYTMFINFDGDGQHNSDHLDDIVYEARKGHEYVVGSRFVNAKRSYSMRMIGSRILQSSIFIKTLGKVRVSDSTSGLICLASPEIAKYYITSKSAYPEPSLYPKIHKKGFKISQVQAEMNERIDGESYFNALSSVKFMYQQIIMILMGF